MCLNLFKKKKKDFETQAFLTHFNLFEKRKFLKCLKYSINP